MPNRRLLVAVGIGALLAGIAVEATVLLRDRADGLASSELRQTVAAADERIAAGVAGARATAAQLAADPAVVAFLTAPSRPVPKIVRAHPEASIFDAHGTLRAGRAIASPFVATAIVRVAGRTDGRVRVTAPFAPIAQAAAPPYRLTLVRAGPGSEAVTRLVPGVVTVTTLDGERVRALRQSVGSDSLVATVKVADVGLARSTELYIWIAAAGAFMAVFLLLPPVGRAGARAGAGAAASPETLRLFGEALAATHEPRSLLAAFLRIAVETTGARGGTVLEDGRVVDRIGSSSRDDVRIPLRVKGNSPARTLTLRPPRGGFSSDALGRAEDLGLQASAALTNAYLHELVSEQSQTDELTSLANRRHFIERLDVELTSAIVRRLPLSIIAADLDHFKDVNDRYGHQAGDLALRHFAGVIGLYTRDIDIPARVGGDEFVVLLPQTVAIGAEALAERIRLATSSAHLAAPDGRTYTVTSSFGVATVEGETISADALLARADAALYRAKAAGRNTVSS